MRSQQIVLVEHSTGKQCRISSQNKGSNRCEDIRLKHRWYMHSNVFTVKMKCVTSYIAKKPEPIAIQWSPALKKYTNSNIIQLARSRVANSLRNK